MQIRLGKTIPLQADPRLRAEKLTAFCNRLAGIGHIHSARIGLIDPFDAAIAIANPDRLLDAFQQATQEFNPFRQFAVLRLKCGTFRLNALQAEEAGDGQTAGRAAIHIKQCAIVGFDRQIEGARMFAQRRNSTFQCRHRLRTQPASESQKCRTILRRAAIIRQLPDHIGPHRMAIPDDDPLILEIEKRFIALRSETQIGEF